MCIIVHCGGKYHLCTKYVQYISTGKVAHVLAVGGDYMVISIICMYTQLYDYMSQPT